MILYEVNGRQGCYFTKSLRDARKMFNKEKEAGNDVELAKVKVNVTSQLVIELLNGYWKNARTLIEVIDEYDPFADNAEEEK